MDPRSKILNQLRDLGVDTAEGMVDMVDHALSGPLGARIDEQRFVSVGCCVQCFFKFGYHCCRLEGDPGHSSSIGVERVNQLDRKVQYLQVKGGPRWKSAVGDPEGRGNDLGQKQVEGLGQGQNLTKMAKQRIDHLIIEPDGRGPAQAGKEKGSLHKFRECWCPPGLEVNCFTNRYAEVFGRLRDSHGLPKWLRVSNPPLGPKMVGTNSDRDAERLAGAKP
jgi:hypothetical protein